jgi:hypothetical protein
MTNAPDGVRRWSTSDVEHLRAIHLLLVVTSVGLILVALSAKPYQPAAALTQLEEIQRLQKEWSPEFLDSQIEANRLTAESVGKPTGHWAQFPQKAPYDFPCWVGEREYNCKPEQNWWAPKHDHWSLTSFPKTIAEFKEFWDALAAPQEVDFVENIGEGVTVDGTSETIAVLDPGRPKGKVSGVPNQTPLPVRNKSLWLVKSGDKKQFWDTPEGGGKFHTWEIPVQSVWSCQIDRKVLTKIVPTWKPGDFESAFRDLAQASGGLEELEFADVRRQFETESASGSEVFEVAGLKVPMEQLTTVGIIALLCIQLYLLILLRELSDKLHSDDSGWDVPWIGMYASLLAQIATWTSIIICPVAAVGFLACHGVQQARSEKAYSFAALLALSALLSVVLAGSSWIYRPSLASEKSSS